MNISEFFVRRPVFTTLFMISIILFGFISYRALPISILPNIDFPTIQVTVNFPGADPDTMASSVALPLEQQFTNIEGVDSMNSVNTSGTTSITLQFSLDRNIDGAAQDVQAAIAAAEKQLPINLPNPPSFKKVNPSDAPIFYLALTSDTVPLSEVDYYAETLIAERLSMLDGIAQVQVYGSQQFAVRVQVDPHKLPGLGIGLDDIAQTISQNNANLPTGSLYGKNIFTTIQAPGQLKTAQEYNDVILMYRNGSPLFLKNVANAIDSVANNKIAAWYNNKRGIALSILRQPGSNTIEIVKEIKKVLPELRKEIPAGVNIDILYDRSESIINSVDDVKTTLIIAFILVIIIIYLFLKDFYFTFVPTFALPLSIIGTFAIMFYLNYSIDNLSLMALTLSVGFVVDDAIVMLENIMRHMEMGKTKLQATLEGAKEIGFTIISMTLSLIAVFIPILFMEGIVGMLLHEFAVTISVAILISGVISLTVTPMLCNFFLPNNIKVHKEEKRGLFVSFTKLYEVTLKQVLIYKKSSMGVFIVLLFLTGYLFTITHKGFLPDEDSGQLSVSTEASQNISFDAMIIEQKKVADIVMANPHIEALMSSVGATGRSPSLNQGTMLIKLKPRKTRPDSTTIIEELRPLLAPLPGIKTYIRNIPTITIGGASSKSLYQYTLLSIDQETLFNFVPKLMDKIKNIKGITDLNSDLQISQPQIFVDIDRAKAAELGISITQVQNTLYYAYGASQISTIYESTGQYQVILELEPKYQTDISSLSMLYIKANNGAIVPLSSIATLRETVGPLSISHFGQLSSVTISFNLAPNMSLGEATDKIEEATQELHIPDKISGVFQGTAQAFLNSLGDINMLMIMAIVVIYIILGMLYESFIHPITILAGIPTAGFGALLTLVLFNKQLDLYGFVGLIMLIGIVKKNAIMIIDFTIELQKTKNISPEQAVFEACIIRFRPIMMTSFAALMGALPIAFAYGATGPQRQSLGLAVVGGLLTSQILTLYITPVIYLYLNKITKLRFNK